MSIPATPSNDASGPPGCDPHGAGSLSTSETGNVVTASDGPSDDALSTGGCGSPQGTPEAAAPEDTGSHHPVASGGPDTRDALWGAILPLTDAVLSSALATRQAAGVQTLSGMLATLGGGQPSVASWRQLTAGKLREISPALCRAGWSAEAADAMERVVLAARTLQQTARQGKHPDWRNAFARICAALGHRDSARARVAVTEALHQNARREADRRAHREAVRISREAEAAAEAKRIAAKRLVAQQDLMAAHSAIWNTLTDQPTVEAWDLWVAAWQQAGCATLTPTRARRMGLAAPLAEAMTRALAERAIAVRSARTIAVAAKRVERDWRASLLPAYAVPEALGCTTVEYQRWLASGRLTATARRAFRKWGRDLETPLFDPAALSILTPDVLASWRAADAAVTSANRRRGARAAGVVRREHHATAVALGLANFASEFYAARAQHRRIVVCLGPTNSGKTHRAIEALKHAASGVYLAPLRLLALEAWDRLRAEGIPATLLTGEEYISDPGAQHVCCTIEMADFTRPVDVAVVDEAQMLQDRQRGWAWTSALLGIPAATVYVCGPNEVEPAVRTLLASATTASGAPESIETERFFRLAPLRVTSVTATLQNAEPGDAFIAFSRKEVLATAAKLHKQGHRPAVLYGALAPEVRRAQVSRVRDGSADCVVATDAIGMGLNLPIRRVVFTAVEKFDGTRVRALTATEVNQIAGRAGRYGVGAPGDGGGLVTATSGPNLEFLRRAVGAGLPIIKPPFSVRPTWAHIAQIQRLHPGTVLSALLRFAKLKFGSLFVPADLSAMLAHVTRLSSIGLSDEALFRWACAPADPDRNDDVNLLFRAASAWHRGTSIDINGLGFDPQAPCDRYSLECAEAASRHLTLCHWVHVSFPGVVRTTAHDLDQRRSLLTRYIGEALLHPRSVAPESMSAPRRDRYWDDLWGREDDEDGGYEDDRRHGSSSPSARRSPPRRRR